MSPSIANCTRIASKPTGMSGVPSVPRRSRSPSTLTDMDMFARPMLAATIWQVSWAQAASAPSRRSPEQAADPGPPTPGWASASYSARPMSTEQLIAPSSEAPVARSVMPAALGSSRYLSLIGCWISLRLMSPRSGSVVIRVTIGLRASAWHHHASFVRSTARMANLATGTVTLVFTDIEGSTRLLRELGGRYEQVLEDQRRLIRAAFGARNGSEVDTAGDGLFYAFPRAREALLAAVEGQQALGRHDWPLPVRVRMGLHTGEPLSSATGFVGLDVHRASRICAAAHGGQILVSQTTRDLASDLPGEVVVLDLGEHSLKDLPAPEHLFQVLAPDLLREFPPLRSLDSRPNNLPRQLTTFVGREREIGDAKRILASAPLLTLTGPGGVGKTRLAIEIAGELLDEFDEGIWFVDLGVLTDPDFVVPAIASAIGVMPA